MKVTIESLLADALEASWDGRRIDAATYLKEAETRIGVLRNRIDELGGYHDDI